MRKIFKFFTVRESFLKKMKNFDKTYFSFFLKMDPFFLTSSLIDVIFLFNASFKSFVEDKASVFLDLNSKILINFFSSNKISLNYVYMSDNSSRKFSLLYLEPFFFKFLRKSQKALLLTSGHSETFIKNCFSIMQTTNFNKFDLSFNLDTNIDLFFFNKDNKEVKFYDILSVLLDINTVNFKIESVVDKT